VSAWRDGSVTRTLTGLSRERSLLIWHGRCLVTIALQPEDERRVEEIGELDQSGSTSFGWRAAGPLVGLVFLVVVVVVVWRLGDVRRFADLVQRARPAWLLVAVAFQATTYVCAGAIWWIVFRRATTSASLRRLTVLSVGKVFIDQTLPSGGVTGDLFMLRALVRRGTSGGVGIAAVIVNLFGFYGALIIATAASLLLFWMHRTETRVLIVATVVFVAIALVVSSVVLALLHGSRSRLRRLFVRFAPLRVLVESFAQAPRDAMKDRLSLGGSFVLQLATVSLDAWTLYATLAAVGERPSPGAVFATYIFAKIAEITGMVPGGFGTFEGTCVALLHVSGVRFEPALAATLLLRGFTFWLPMLPGLWIVRRELRQTT